MNKRIAPHFKVIGAGKLKQHFHVETGDRSRVEAQLATSLADVRYKNPVGESALARKGIHDLACGKQDRVSCRHGH